MGGSLPTLVIACLELAAMSAFGVAALRRARLGLSPLEEIAYGMPLGQVVASLALIPLATVFGLSSALVIALGLVCATVAWRLWPVRPTLPALRLSVRKGFLQPGKLGLVGSGGPLALPRLESSHLVDLLPPLVLGVLILRIAVFWKDAIGGDGAGGLTAGHTFLYSDWGLHLGDTASFAYGDNFPPQNPRLPGHAFPYHYLASVTAAALVKLGVGLAAALELASFLGSVAIVLGVYAFALRLTGDRHAAALTVPLFLFGSGLAWLTKLNDLKFGAGGWTGVFDNPWEYGSQVAANIHMVPYFFRTASERAYSFGLPLGLLTLTLLLEGTRTGRRRSFLGAGVAAGLLPLAHLSTLMALALITPFVFLVSPRRPWRFGDRQVLLPDRGWLVALAAAACIAAPQLYAQLGGGTGAAGGMRIQVGWLADPDPWLWFWLKNLGWFLLLVPLALADRKLVPPLARRVLWAFMPIFALANLVLFQPAPWDNAKVLLWWFLAASVLVAALLTKTWREHPVPVVRALIVSVVAMLLLSGVLANVDQLLGHDRFPLYSQDELLLTGIVREQIPSDALFVAGLQGHHPVLALAGRRVVMGPAVWLWNFGVPAWDREQDVHRIYEFGPDAPELIEQYGADYVVIGPFEREAFAANESAFRARYPVVIQTEHYVVFDVGTGGD